MKLIHIIFITIVLAIVASFTVAKGQHAQGHDYYKEWLTIEGGSCCNDQDCDVAERWRSTKDGYEVYYKKEWLKVPPTAIRPYATFDGNAHVCIFNGRILCFVKGIEG